jgi:plasmid segregation protein ParM
VSDFGEEAPFEYLHVTIDGNDYFIGELAEHQCIVRHFTLDQKKMITNFNKILALTAAGYLAEENEPVKLVSGLPVAYFKQNRDQFSRTLKGRHEIIFHRPDGAVIQKLLTIEDILMMPQPVGSALNLFLDDDGNVSNRRIAERKIGIIDIGFKTTDLTILDRLQYIDRGSRTLDVGISKAFGIISNKLREKSGVSVELYRLYKSVEAGSIKIRGQEYNFSAIRDQVYSRLAQAIANDVDRLWSEDWDIDTIIFSGGGCIELARFLTPLITGNMIPVHTNVDSRLNNVKGYLKYGHFRWKNRPTASPPHE